VRANRFADNVGGAAVRMGVATVVAWLRRLHASMMHVEAGHVEVVRLEAVRGPEASPAAVGGRGWPWAATACGSSAPSACARSTPHSASQTAAAALVTGSTATRSHFFCFSTTWSWQRREDWYTNKTRTDRAQPGREWSDPSQSGRLPSVRRQEPPPDSSCPRAGVIAGSRGRLVTAMSPSGFGVPDPLRRPLVALRLMAWLEACGVACGVGRGLRHGVGRGLSSSGCGRRLRETSHGRALIARLERAA
jgi:hypothetical protein